MIGPGKGTGNDIVEFIKNELEADAVVLVVIGGNVGNIAGAKMDLQHYGMMPDLLRKMADEMEKDKEKAMHMAIHDVISNIMKTKTDEEKTNDGTITE